MTEKPPSEGLVVGGRYVLEAPVGTGGSATVFAARDVVSGARVAIKRVHPQLIGRAEVCERLKREGRALLRIHSPFVVPLVDAGSDARIGAFLVSELVDAPSLRTILDADGPLELEVALAIVDQILRGLAAAHTAGVAHRDVSPENVLLVATPEGRVARIVDFGAAWVSGEAHGLTPTGFTVGRPAYAAPETLLEGARDGVGADLYAVGCLLFEALAGVPPFIGATWRALWDSITTDLAPPLAVFRRDLPAPVAAFVARALAKWPTSRFASADEMRGALRRASGAP